MSGDTAFIHKGRLQQKQLKSLVEEGGGRCRNLKEVQKIGTTAMFIFFFLVGGDVPHSMWDLSSLTRDRTCNPCIGSAES